MGDKMSFSFALSLAGANTETFPEPKAGIKTIGVMTCGGDCPGLNPVIRAVVVSAYRNFGWKVLGIEDAMQGLINLDYRSPYGNMWLTPFIVEDIIAVGGTIIGTDNKSDPFRFKVVNDEGVAEEKDVSATVAENFQKYGIPFVGVPKTIDNDLGGTDMTFGFSTAVAT